MNNLHFMFQIGSGRCWHRARNFPLEYDLQLLEKMCELWHKQDARRRHARVVLMPINFLIARGIIYLTPIAESVGYE